jgi:protocatechuate 3,4-dioxygenase alpha subunit
VLRRLFTRIYFADEAANTTDAILSLVPADRRQTLVAERRERGDSVVYTFNIRLQGDGETVFFTN